MGDPAAPPVGESTDKMLAAYTKAFPDLLRVTNEGAVPAAQAQLAANQATAPGLAALQAQLYQTYGPLLGKTSNQIAAQQSEDQAQSDLNVVKGTGRDLVKEALTTQQIADPEYYKARGEVGNNLSRLFSSIDPSGQLSTGEREALSRGQAQENQQRGLTTAPSQTAAIEGAVKFGGAQRARELQGQSSLNAALQTANQALPALKSGVDVFQVATGRSSMPNAGDSKFTGVDTGLGANAASTGSNLLGQIGGLTQQQNDINSKRRDSLDRFNESFSSTVGSL